jgi:hypothetical protein
VKRVVRFAVAMCGGCAEECRPGHRSYVGRVRPSDATIAFALNTQEDPTSLVIPVVQALATTKR